MHPQARRCSGAGDQVHDGREVQQRLASPVPGDEGEETVLDPVYYPQVCHFPGAAPAAELMHLLWSGRNVMLASEVAGVLRKMKCAGRRDAA